MTTQRWRLLLWTVMVAAVLFAIRPLHSRFDPETLFLQSDKVFHMLYFASLWWLARRAGFSGGWALALSLLAYGVGIEVAQQLAPTQRSASLADVAADSVGIAIGWGLSRLSFGQPEKHRG